MTEAITPREDDLDGLAGTNPTSQWPLGQGQRNRMNFKIIHLLVIIFLLSIFMFCVKFVFFPIAKHQALYGPWGLHATEDKLRETIIEGNRLLDGKLYAKAEIKFKEATNHSKRVELLVIKHNFYCYNYKNEILNGLTSSLAAQGKHDEANRTRRNFR